MYVTFSGVADSAGSPGKLANMVQENARLQERERALMDAVEDLSAQNEDLIVKLRESMQRELEESVKRAAAVSHNVSHHHHAAAAAAAGDGFNVAAARLLPNISVSQQQQKQQQQQQQQYLRAQSEPTVGLVAGGEMKNGKKVSVRRSDR
jgi:hypothetical protein